jgi:cell division protein FtsI (penicillin-binding protein 3)
MKPVVTRRRIVITVALVAVMLVTCFLRLMDIQVVRAPALNAQARGKMSIPNTVFATRGDIVDRGGVVLAQAEMRYDITASPRDAQDFERTVDGKKVTITPAQAAVEIANISKQDPNVIIAALNDALAKDPTSEFAYLVRNVDLATFQSIKKLDIPWVYFQSAPSRIYPNGAVAGNLVGYVGSDTTPLAGLEKTQNDCVGSVDGQATYERGASDGVMIPGSEVLSKQVKNGGRLQLTIDSDVQWYAQQRLAQQVKDQRGSWGIAVVLEVKTGKLVSVADYPSVDPNNVDGTASKFRGSYAFSAPYEPGSTMKSLTAAMLLDQNKATAASKTYAPYQVTFPNGASFHDSSHHNPRMTLSGVLVNSSNVGISKFAEVLSPSTRYDYITKFGLGNTTNVDFLGESSGIVHPWQDWDNQTNYVTMFGQGLTATAVQMASAYQALGNGGVRLPVSLVEACTRADGTVVKPEAAAPVRVVSPQAARGAVDILENVYQQGYLKDRWFIPGYRIAAKTGTAQQSNGQGKYSSSYIVTIAGLVPANDPQYVVLTTIADADLNSTAAVAPIFRDLSTYLIKKYRILPSLEGQPHFAMYY